MFAPPGIPTFQYPQQPTSTHSPGAKSKTDVPIHTSPSQPPTGGTAKRQAMEQGRMPSVRAGDCCWIEELNIGRPPRSTFAMTPPMSMVLGYRSTEQTHCDSRCEIERGKHELKEDAATFAPTEPTGNGTPIPYLVNLQSDMTLPSHVHQTVKCAIGFNRCTDFWDDDASSSWRH